MTDDYNVARTVPLAVLRRFLQLEGWRQVSVHRSGIDVFKLGDAVEVEIVLPNSAQAADGGRRIADALRTLSQIYNESIRKVATRVRGVGIDVLRSTVPDSLVRNEAIHLDVAEGFIKHVRQLLSAAATTELAPKPFFERTKKEAKNFAEECRFGHTFRGSFGFTIEAAVTPNKTPTMEILEESPPFERRVMQRIARGLWSVKHAEREQDITPIVSNFATGLSANMCEELVDLAESIKGEALRFEFSFSPEWRVPRDIEPRGEYEVSASNVEIIKDAAKRLRLQDFERNRTVKGLIVHLRSDKDPSNLVQPLGSREITILWVTEDFGKINVRVALKPTEYLLAAEAHVRGQPVRVAGTIDRIGKIWRLLDPQGFGIASISDV